MRRCTRGFLPRTHGTRLAHARSFPARLLYRRRAGSLGPRAAGTTGYRAPKKPGAVHVRPCILGATMPAPSNPSPTSVEAALRKLAERWADAKARERANYQLYIGGLCEALGVEGPRPAGSGYEYELPVKVVDRDGNEASNFVDLFKRDHFVLEAKDKEPGRSDDLMLRKAYGQARSYVTHLPGSTPPYVLVLDVGRTMMVWDRWQGGFGGVNPNGGGESARSPMTSRTPSFRLLMLSSAASTDGASGAGGMGTGGAGGD